MRRQLVEASDRIPLEGIAFPPPDLHLRPTADAVLNRLLYTLFSEAAVECFLAADGRQKDGEEDNDDCPEDHHLHLKSMMEMMEITAD